MQNNALITIFTSTQENAISGLTLTEAVVFLLVGIALLLTGMKMMSGALKRLAGGGLRNLFNRVSKKPLLNFGIGTGFTAIIQSSDATAAMVIGFINAGAMTMFQGLCIILGGYVGTTITGVLASFSSLPISTYLLLIAFIGMVLMMFFKNELVKNIGEILCGLGLFFFALTVMKSSFDNQQIKQACIDIFAKLNNGFLLYLIGVLITALVQSSSAVTSIVIAMVGSGALTVSSGLFIALGATLGTVVNTLLITIGGNVKGKRTAWIAFTLRAFSSLVMCTIMMFTSTKIADLLTKAFSIGGSHQFPIAMFTVLYNIIFMPLMIPLLKPLISLFEKIIKDKEQMKLGATVKYIDDKLLGTPSVALSMVKKEILNMYDLAFDNYELGYQKVLFQNNTADKEIVENEDKVDYLNKRISDFLIRLSNKVNISDDKLIGSYFHVINDIERIGDHAYNFYAIANQMKSENYAFSDSAISEIQTMNNVIHDMFILSRKIFNERLQKELKNLHSLETTTDKLKSEFFTNHFHRISSNECTNELTPFISSLMTEMERVADHLTNIAYSIKNPTGDE